MTGNAPTLWETWFARVVRRLKKNGGKVAFSHTEIEAGILLGSMPRSEADLRSLQDLGVGTIVTLNQKWELGSHILPANITALDLGLTTCWLKTPDYAAPTQQAIRKGVDAIKQALAQKRKVYVHCNAGRGRSAIVVICYMIQKHKWSASTAFDKVGSKRSIANMKHSLCQRQWNSVVKFERAFRNGFPSKSGRVNKVLPGIEATDGNTSAHLALKRISSKGADMRGKEAPKDADESLQLSQSQ